MLIDGISDVTLANGVVRIQLNTVNPDGTDADICPLEYGTLSDPNVRGCPDSDNDGTPDYLDPDN